MARSVIILLLAAVVLGVAGLASAQTAPSPTSGAGGGEVKRGDTASEAAAAALPALGPTTSDDQIGTQDDGAISPDGDSGAATAGSVGGDAPPGSEGSAGTSSAAAEVAGVATVAALAGSFFFF